MNGRQCRICGTSLKYLFADLGMSPLANSYRKPEELHQMEPFYPLQAYVCEKCFLVQLADVQGPEQIFSDYAYFSSYSDTWLKHAQDYTAHIVADFGIGPHNLVIEVASNDGYLLRYFRDRDIPVLGVEPAANVAQVAQAAGIPTLVKFFGVQTAREMAAEGQQADLLVGNNVLAHVPDLHDFVGGLKIALKPRGILTLEFHHLLQLMQQGQFDAVYHEHFSYLSLLAVERVFGDHGLTVFDVRELPTHGGSLRVYARHTGDVGRPITRRVGELRAREAGAGLKQVETYTAFASRIRLAKQKLVKFLLQAKEDGKIVVGYGAPAKGTTLLSYCGLRSDFIDYTVDRSPHKQGRFLPGTHIPIHAPDKIGETRPDYLLILPWNLKDEIMHQMAYVREWGCRFVVAIPEVQVYE